MFPVRALTLCDPMDCSPQGSSVHGILQTILQWVAIPFSRGCSHPSDLNRVSCIAGRFFTIKMPPPPTPPHLHRYCIHGFNQPGMENIWEKILENSRKHNLNLPHTGNCLYNSYMENSAVTTGLEKVSFHPNPKEEQCHRMFKLVHDCTHFTC